MYRAKTPKADSAAKINEPARQDSKQRLNKVLADSGIVSRRKADELIEAGKIKVNGDKVFELGVRVDPKRDVITIDGKRVNTTFRPVYIAFNKTRGVITSMEDPLERPTVAEYFAKLPVRVFPVGRLDWDSEGLLILTNDGDYANKVIHPKSEITKTYILKVSRKLTDSQLSRLKRGVTIVGGRVKAEHIEKIRKGTEDHPWYQFVITEGKNRQVRNMLSKVGADVIKLQRVAIGKLRLGQIERGQFVFMNKAAADRVFLKDLPQRVKTHTKAEVSEKLNFNKIRPLKDRTSTKKKTPSTKKEIFSSDAD